MTNQESTQVGVPLLTAHAYSAESDLPQTPRKQSWRKTCGWVTAVLVSAAAVATAIVAVWIVHPGNTTTTPAQSPSITAEPSVELSTPAPLVMPTVSVQHMIAPEPPEPPKVLAPTCSSDGCDADYLWLLQRDGYRIENAPQAIQNAHLACANLAVTHSIYETHLYMLNTLQIVDPFAKELTVAGTTIYCPNLPY